MAKLENIDLSHIQGQTFIIGRDGHIYIDDESVSRRHASISIRDGKIHLKDLNSKNGTYIVRNNKMVAVEDSVVSPLQTILIGDRKCLVAELLQVAGNFFGGDDATTLLNPRNSGRKASSR